MRFSVKTLLISAAIMLGTFTTGTFAQKPEKQDTRSPQEILFEDGNYAMFIHFGLYSKMESEWKGVTYYGNAEWIMNENQAGIPVQEYMAEAATFNPSEFNAEEVVALAKDAGMKYIVITSKHHEGFAMFKSDVCDFNIYDATPLKRDLIGELADACHRNGLGIGFYYSQFQDWTAPGGGGGPAKNAEGKSVSFDEYFRTKCVPQVEEITTKYGEIELIWFDTPGNMGKQYSEELVNIVRKNQPHALVSSRVGNGLGDYNTLGDMEVPVTNRQGRWEGIDVTQVGWGFSRFDREWKSPEYIVRTLVSTIARGGTFMLNIGPEASGKMPEMAAASLRKSGEWVKKYPKAVYCAESSPWGHALPWGDAVVNDGKIELVVYNWPDNGKLWVPGLESGIKSARLYGGKKLKVTKEGSWVCINVPSRKPDDIAAVIEIIPNGKISSAAGLPIDPVMTTPMTIELSKAENCIVKNDSWMEKFGEWKFKIVATQLKEESCITWKADIKDAGVYNIMLEYKGSSPIQWEMTLDDSDHIKNRQSASNAYAWHNLGWVTIDKPGTHTFSLRVSGGGFAEGSLSSMSLTRVNL